MSILLLHLLTSRWKPMHRIMTSCHLRSCRNKMRDHLNILSVAPLKPKEFLTQILTKKSYISFRALGLHPKGLELYLSLAKKISRPAVCSIAPKNLQLTNTIRTIICISHLLQIKVWYRDLFLIIIYSLVVNSRLKIALNRCLTQKLKLG
jgi:hypothetical protein